MKLSATIALIILGIVLSVRPASAEELRPRTSTASTAKETRRETENKNLPKIQAQRQEVRAHVAEVHGKQLDHRFGVYYERLNKIINRLQERLDALHGEGKDTTAVQVKLTEAKATLASAKTAADSAVKAFLAIPADKYEEQRALALQARDIANQARADFMKVFEELKEVVRLMKAL